jgi:hypothetical protein
MLILVDNDKIQYINTTVKSALVKTTYLMQKKWRQFINLRRIPSTSIHNKGPQVCARGHRTDKKAIFISFLYMLRQPRICNIVVVSTSTDGMRTIEEKHV